MLKSLSIALLAGAVAAVPACKKSQKSSSQASDTSGSTDKGDDQTGAGTATDSSKPGGDTASGGDMEVTTPTADDLSTYTADLTGDGPLMATFETSLGTIHCELLDKGAPLTVANFVGLARGMKAFKDPVSHKVEKRPYYDGTVFHRVIPGFMIQGGDPTATGNGGPGYEFKTEVSPDLTHEPGTLSMANAGPDTNGSQFFITEVATHKLDGSYNVFGRCKDLDVVKKIARVPTTEQPGDPRHEKSRPVDEVKLVKVTISRGEPGAGDAKDGEGGKDAKGDDADKGGKKTVKHLTKPAHPPTGAAEPDHHDH